MKKTLHSVEGELANKWVKTSRLRLGLTQKQLSEMAGVSRSEISKMESHERRVDLVKLYLLCRVFRDDPVRVARRFFRAFDSIRQGRPAHLDEA
ncbi:MAG: helix-turn-helix domain-containing protein [Planctomycetes bacterium]|nr:helix-turn-helix domain-containing protein [Planctomycetota bacterium]